MRMMKKKLPIGILICTLLLTGCGRGEPASIQVIHNIVPKEEMQIDVYLPQDMIAGKYEPEAAVYLGADVEHNVELEGKMNQFEKMIDKEQAFRVFQYKKRGDISSTEILECIASKEVPYVKVMPNNRYDLMPVYEMIGDLSTRYESPIFIELFPVSGQEMDPILYTKYYEDGYKLIKKYIKDAVVVWSIDWNQVYDTPIYYPGNHLVDWVGLNVAIPKYRGGKAFEVTPEERIDFWYKTFQNEKPMMLSTLAVSHFSRIDHTYTIEDTKNKLNYFYNQMTKDYPRIKGIIYSDVDMYQVTAKGTEDYRITSQKKLREHMQGLQDQEVFKSEVTKEERHKISVPILYTVTAFRIDERIYVKEAQVEYLKIPKSIMRQVPCITDETMVKYYELMPLVAQASGWVAQENLQN